MSKTLNLSTPSLQPSAKRNKRAHQADTIAKNRDNKSNANAPKSVPKPISKPTQKLTSQSMQKPTQETDEILIGRVQHLYISRFTKQGAYLIASPIQIQESKRDTPLHTQAHKLTSSRTQDSMALFGQDTLKAKIHDERAHLPLLEVLLPNKFLPPQHHINDKLEVFVYTDSKDRPIATTQRPKAQYNDIAILEVIGHNAFGCFLNLGIDKDLFMPCKNPTRFILNQKVAVIITLDKQSRLIAKTDIQSFLHKTPAFAPHSKVNAFVFERTPLGFGCAVQGEKDTKKYYGLLFHNAIPQGECVNLGTYINAYTQGYRPDSKLNLTLFAPHNDAQKSLLLDSMPLDLNFSASPETIFERFHISKKLFKRLINELVREGEITFDKQSAMFKRIK